MQKYYFNRKRGKIQWIRNSKKKRKVQSVSEGRKTSQTSQWLNKCKHIQSAI